MASELGLNLDENDPLKKDQEIIPGASGGASITGGGGGAAQGQPVTAGAGGQGGWTNIQNYLTANKGDTGSSQLLNKAVGDQFGQEKQNIQSGADSFLKSAQDQANSNKIDENQANDYINQASGMYDYGGKQNDQYKGIVDKFQSALTTPYSGPNEYNYGLGAKTQKYGEDLNNPGNFDVMMKDIYSGAAGSPLTSGQYNLQKQFDVNNSNLDQAKSGLQNQYQDLTNTRDKTVADTTKALSGIRKDYGDAQNSLNTYLGLQRNNYDTKEGQAEAGARSAYDNTYKTDTSGRSGSFSAPGHNPRWDLGAIAPYGGVGNNQTWEQLQKENNMTKDLNSANGLGNILLGHDFNGNPYGGHMAEANNYTGNMDALNNFYNQQTQKYSNTGDQEKKSYNAILDFLNAKDARKQAGFNVRG